MSLVASISTSSATTAPSSPTIQPTHTMQIRYAKQDAAKLPNCSSSCASEVCTVGGLIYLDGIIDPIVRGAVCG